MVVVHRNHEGGGRGLSRGPPPAWFQRDPCQHRRAFLPRPVNREGQAPFVRRNNVYDFAQPNDVYFAHVDYVLNVARSKGLLVLMTPAYLGFQGGQEGWWPEINTAVNTEAVMENYGRYLGNRYRGFSNIVWVMGGGFSTPMNA